MYVILPRNHPPCAIRHMNSYDDLQRFKEKTQTNHIEFKDMSEQTLNSTTTNWAIIKQLLNEGAGSVLDNSQRIDRAVPQPVDFAAFTSSSVENAPAISSLPVQSFVPATPDASDRVGASLLDSISASLQPAAVVPAQPVFQAPTAPVPQPVATQPVIAAHSPADEAPANVSYKQLFSTAAAPGSAALPKDMLLHPLLEKIASCR
ncbi:cellulose biosynthesis protein BcsO [Erwinia rhapontici]|uniref:cellulose biosynthesis protein BcsO n=1 Tax=Erwinia rhapontici TaxID=55212 RepID=UPI003BA20B7B